jgi:hypothetical protein
MIMPLIAEYAQLASRFYGSLKPPPEIPTPARFH